MKDVLPVGGHAEPASLHRSLVSPSQGVRLGKKKRSAAVGTCFFNEARAANLVQHPAIVRVFDYGTTSTGTAYLAMEFLEGESLRSRLQRQHTLSEAETIRIGRQIAAGLATAHQSQVVHRDLKPDTAASEDSAA